MEDSEHTTPEDLQLLKDLGYPSQEEKNSIFSFFKRIIASKDTTRTANLTFDELGAVKLPVRTAQMLSLYCKSQGLHGLAAYFQAESQIVTNSSLSREGFLDKLAVTQKREVNSLNRRSELQQNTGWFKKKVPHPQEV